MEKLSLDIKHVILNTKPLNANRPKVYVIIFAVMVIGMGLRSLALPMLSWKFHLASFFVGIVFLPALWEMLGVFVRYLDYKLPFERGVGKRIIFQMLFSYALYLVVAAISYTPLAWVFSHVLSVGEVGYLLTRPFIMLSILTSIIFVVSANLGYIGHYFFTRWKAELVRAAQLEKERSEIQFESLKNQLNPHFLFNALTSLNSLIFENQQLASEFVQQLSKVFRYVLQTKDKEYVPLGTELAFVQHYLRLLQTRFDGALRVVVEVSPEVRERLIVPVTLQTLIENAIKHNIVSEERPLEIRIASRTDDDGSYLCISNTLQRKTIVEHSNKQGLASLKLLYSYITPHPVNVVETPHTFAIELPLL